MNFRLMVPYRVQINCRNNIRFVSLLFFFCQALPGWSQADVLPNQKQEQKLTLRFQNTPLTDVLDVISKQARVRFMYTGNQVSHQTKISLEANQQPLKSVLSNLLTPLHLSYEIDRDLVFIQAIKPIKNNNSGPKTNDISVTGVVTDKAGLPLPGVTVKAKSVGTITDSKGTFNLLVPEDTQVLYFSYIGFKTQEVPVKNQIIVTLEEDLARLNEVVVIGYGSQIKPYVTGSISQVKAAQLQQLPATNFEQALAGQVAGVQVLQTSGAPGRNLEFRIRGLGTITAGHQPLIMVDGFPVSDASTSSLNPEDIETIDILKDAAAAAIYGSRGANGVVVITTKSGQADIPKIAFKSYYGLQRVAQQVDMMDAYENAAVLTAARHNSWLDANPANRVTDPNSVRNKGSQVPEFAFPYLSGERGLTNTNWQDAIFQDAQQHNYDVSISGAKESLQYYVSGNYLNQEGIIINSGFKRYALRTNLETRLSPRVKVGLNLAPAFTQHKLVSEKSYKNDGIVLSALLALPNFPVYNPDGSLAISQHIKEGANSTVWVENPVALATLIDDKLEQSRFLGGTHLEVELQDGLLFKTYLGGDLNTARQNYFRPSTLGTYRSAAPTLAVGNVYTARTWNWANENTVSYIKSFAGKHNLSLLAGYTIQKENMERNFMSATNFPNDQVRTLNAGQVTEGYSTIEEWSLLSYLGRAVYDYKGKYLLTASLRRDGSSRFGKNSRWGYFPSASGGWRISEEAFFPENRFMQEVKLRASYGRTGNNQIPNYGAVALITPANYILNGTRVSGLAPQTSPNENLSWEKKDMTNAGLDLVFFNNQLTLTTDYYWSVTKGLLLNVPVPESSGYSYSLQNLGKVQNKGLEVALAVNSRIGNVKVTSAVNISTNRNKVLALGPGQERILNGNHITQIGQPIGSFYGYQVLGVFQDQADLDAYPHVSTSKPGSFKYADTDGNGKINDQDRTIIGNAFPDYMFGFNNTLEYKNFDLNFLIQGVQGYEVFNLTRAFTSATQGWSNGTREVYKSYYQSAAEPGQGVSRPLTSPTDKLHEQSDYMLEDASFVRVRSITLGYKLPAGILGSKLKESPRLYFSTKNPFTFTHYSGYNPEVSSYTDDPTTPGVDYGAYPVEKSFVLGIHFTL